MTRLELFGKAMKWNAAKQIWEPHKLINHKHKVNIKSNEQPSTADTHSNKKGNS